MDNNEPFQSVNFIIMILIYNEKKSPLFFETLSDEDKKAFLDYELTVYFCSGTDKEKLDWFRVINIASEKLMDQELRNAVYVGPFVTDARRHFSKHGCPAYKIGCDYMTGKLDEQAYLETILKWAARHDGIREEKPIDKYMAIHQFDLNANKLWAYYMQIMTWVRSTFPHYRKEMKGLDWGAMFDDFGDNEYDVDMLEKQIHDLMEDDEVKKSGIYRYVLSGDLRDLSFRTFGKKQKREAYERQGGICALCGKHFELEDMEADHITPWKEGGTTIAENCQMLCRECNSRKSSK